MSRSIRYLPITLQAGSDSTSLSPVVMTLTPQGLTTSQNNSVTLTPIAISLTPQSLTNSVGDITTSISPVVMALVPEPLAIFEKVTFETKIQMVSHANVSAFVLNLNFTAIVDVATNVLSNVSVGSELIEVDGFQIIRASSFKSKTSSHERSNLTVLKEYIDGFQVNRGEVTKVPTSNKSTSNTLVPYVAPLPRPKWKPRVMQY